MMENLLERCEDVFKSLIRFSDKILLLRYPVSEDRITALEQHLSYKLPFDFKYMLNKTNGFSLLGTEVLGIGDELEGSSLDKVYEFEHYSVGNNMPKEFLPFSPDGRGNHYCLDLGRLEGDICPVIFWQRDFEYANPQEVETVNVDFVSWVNEVMIEWTLEEYDYDGSKK